MNMHEIVGHRLHNQHLSGSAMSVPGKVVGWLGAMQAQDYPGAKWSIGARLAGASDGDIDRELIDGTILRTHLMRPTWHFVLPADIRWIQRLTASRVHALMAPYRRSLGLDADVLDRSSALLRAALGDGQRLTRSEISALLHARGIAVEGVPLGHVLMHAELNLVICSGGLRGKQQTYALLDERAPPAPAMARDDALAELTRRYYASHGPATERDFAWWSGLTLADVRRGLASAASELEAVSVEGRIYRFAPTSPIPAGVSHRAHLLQGYDEFVIGYGQSRDLLDVAGIVTSGADERLRIHVVIVDGQLVARWRRVVDRRSVIVDLKPERQLSAPELRAVDGAVERYAAFLGTPVTLDMDR